MSWNKLGTPTNIDILKGKRIGLIGSSSMDIDYGAKNFMEHIADRTGCVLVNYADAGSYLTGAQDGTNQKLRLNQMPLDVDLILLQVGLNDDNSDRVIGSFDSTTPEHEFYASLHQICKILYARFPFTPAGFMAGQYTMPNTDKTSPYHEAIKEVGGFYGVPVCDLKKEGRVPYTYTDWQTVHAPDGKHMDEEGNLILSRRVESFMRMLLGGY